MAPELTLNNNNTYIIFILLQCYMNSNEYKP